ncbi:DUF349 domain-containing protein [Flavobacteriaceae bacterium]|nr:DUF349 domain-containing protein [Flavobacteriaceae bacterium]MDB2314012.1 DUF349 domain-containing protein [Flavobacteriaceae bacterium]MDC3238357.1 DUF349 domain-containing protein [Flavobacteriaceae bacterium]
MANTNDIANDPQEEKKVQSSETIPPPEGASEPSEATSEEDTDVTNEVAAESEDQKNSETPQEQTKDFSQLSFTELVEEFQKRIKAEQWFTDDKNIKEIIHTFETKFKSEIQEKKEDFIKEGGNEIDFYFKPQYKNAFDQNFREYKKNKRTYFQEREQAQKLNLDRKLEIIESLKELINIDENINTIYKKFKNLQDSWHKTGPVPRAQSNNVWQTYKHHTEIFYDFLHLNRELRDLDFKHNYEEKIKIIEQAESLSKIPDVLKASRDLNTLHRLWKNDLGPVAKEHREELWERFQAASQIIHARRQEFDKEYDNILEENLNKKNSILDRMEEIKNNPPQNHNEWRKTIDEFNKMRAEFQSIGQVTKKFSKTSWNRFREISREINREKNQFYKSQKAEQKKNIDLKKALITEVKEILENEDWRSYNNRMKNIQKDWRSVGFIPRKLSNTLWEEFRSQCNLYFERIKSGYQRINKNELEAYQNKETFIKSIAGIQMPPELEPFKEFFNYQWEEFSKLGQLSGNTNSKSIEDFNKAFIALIDKSDMEKSVKAEAKNHIHFSLIKDDENGLSHEIQNIKKIIEEFKSEARQLENNLEYFSNSSADNPLLIDVTSKLNRLKSEIEKHKEKLIGLRKLKREAVARNTADQEESIDEEGIEGETEV